MNPRDDTGFTIAHVFDAPRDVVFKVWTDPKYVAQWWGTKGSTSTVHALDLRPGGEWHIDMNSPNGNVYANRGVYLEVVVNERIVYRNAIGSGVFTITFEERGKQTRVTMHATFDSTSERDHLVHSGMEQGINEGLDRLANLLRDSNFANSIKDTNKR